MPNPTDFRGRKAVARAWRWALAGLLPAVLLAGEAPMPADSAGPSLPAEKEEALTGRALVVRYMEALKSPFAAERLDAIAALGGVADGAALSSLGAPAALIAIARDKNTFERERIAALRALAKQYAHGVPMETLLSDVIRLVREERGERIRVRALEIARGILASSPNTEKQQMANQQVFERMRKDWDGRAKADPPMPPGVQRAFIVVFGEYTGREIARVRDGILVPALTDTDPQVRLGALEALRRVSERAPWYDRNLLTRLRTFCLRAENETPTDRELRRAALGVLEILARNDKNIINVLPTLRAELHDILHKGSDDEVDAVLRVLMIVANADTVGELIRESRPRPQGEEQLSLETHVNLLRALVESMRPLRLDLENLESRLPPVPDEVNAQWDVIGALGKHLLSFLLNPSAPEPLRREAARGMGFWPPKFGPAFAVVSLVALFEPQYRLSPEALLEVEESLHFLTGQRFRLLDANERLTIVDVPAWQEWLRNNRDALTAEK